MALHIACYTAYALRDRRLPQTTHTHTHMHAGGEHMCAAFGDAKQICFAFIIVITAAISLLFAFHLLVFICVVVVVFFIAKATVAAN